MCPLIVKVVYITLCIRLLHECVKNVGVDSPTTLIHPIGQASCVGLLRPQSENLTSSGDARRRCPAFPLNWRRSNPSTLSPARLSVCVLNFTLRDATYERNTPSSKQLVQIFQWCGCLVFLHTMCREVAHEDTKFEHGVEDPT